MNRRFKKPGTHVDHSQRPNLIKHQPNARIWRADITYLELRPGTWVYLSSIYEPKVHQVLAFKIGRQMEETLVVEMIWFPVNKIDNLNRGRGYDPLKGDT